MFCYKTYEYIQLLTHFFSCTCKEHFALWAWLSHAQLILSHWCWERDTHLGTAAMWPVLVKVNSLTDSHTSYTFFPKLWHNNVTVSALKQQLIRHSHTSHELTCKSLLDMHNWHWNISLEAAKVKPEAVQRVPECYHQLIKYSCKALPSLLFADQH